MEPSPAEEAGAVEPRRTPVDPPDEEALLEMGRRLLEDPENRARIERVLADPKTSDPKEPGVTAEELPAFLREHGF